MIHSPIKHWNGLSKFYVRLLFHRILCVCFGFSFPFSLKHWKQEIWRYSKTKIQRICITSEENMMSTCPFQFGARVWVRIRESLYSSQIDIISYFYLFVVGNINFILLLTLFNRPLCLSRTTNRVLYRVCGTIYLIEKEDTQWKHCRTRTRTNRSNGMSGGGGVQNEGWRERGRQRQCELNSQERAKNS